ncbi:MAG: hypothetical protein N3D10_00325 [Candidatus Micrarchaeota archaeon]|nr:hypothetical protein [Candidatus Micrarchaeota archaeon]
MPNLFQFAIREEKNEIKTNKEIPTTTMVEFKNLLFRIATPKNSNSGFELNVYFSEPETNQKFSLSEMLDYIVNFIHKQDSSIQQKLFKIFLLYLSDILNTDNSNLSIKQRDNIFTIEQIKDLINKKIQDHSKIPVDGKNLFSSLQIGKPTNTNWNKQKWEEKDFQLDFSEILGPSKTQPIQETDKISQTTTFSENKTNEEKEQSTTVKKQKAEVSTPSIKPGDTPSHPTTPNQEPSSFNRDFSNLSYLLHHKEPNEVIIQDFKKNYVKFALKHNSSNPKDFNKESKSFSEFLPFLKFCVNNHLYEPLHYALTFISNFYKLEINLNDFSTNLLQLTMQISTKESSMEQGDIVSFFILLKFLKRAKEDEDNSHTFYITTSANKKEKIKDAVKYFLVYLPEIKDDTHRDFKIVLESYSGTGMKETAMPSHIISKLKTSFSGLGLRPDYFLNP